ncbi:hypothetical protein [Microbulbifer rhizosphaerae]|uniref:Uncharacterized protein n=1 Tax=Microbulbifer rhizosphaerae TaxID=1562603 RepID=A0A7W4WBT7_9GAMM|nr:hypothetical protein [Microbulbifer rhizosphaerae]MBB3060696.1 hypothetical protein [Microbulbifer rhizosphaerae]
MDIEAILKTILKPIYLRVILIILAMILLFRNVSYLLLGDIYYIFNGQQSQRIIEFVFEKEIPALIMTVLWPVAFTFFNIIHEKIRLQKDFFMSVLMVHTFSCLATAFILLYGGCGGENCNQKPLYLTVIGGSLLTMLSVGLSYWLYSKKECIFAAELTTFEADKI